MTSKQTAYDVVILGTGPAGLQAAIHAARKRVSVLVLGRMARSSLFHAHIENFCSIFNLAGEDMLRIGREQAANFGADIREEDVLGVSSNGSHFDIRLESGQEVSATALILATGTSRNRLGVPGEKDLLGKGVSYCVECDGNFFRDQAVCVTGSGSAAADGALTMSQIATRVYLISESLEITGPLREELDSSRVEIVEGRKIEAITGESEVDGVQLAGGDRLEVSGVFIELGAKGVMELAMHLGLEMDDAMKYIVADKQQASSVSGIFAAGDICGPPWQMAKAVGEGCVAGIHAATYAKKH
jgi:thioredoxin reductase (NADPH)